MSRILSHVIFWICFMLWSSAIVDWHNFSVNCDKSFFSNVKHIAIRLPLIMASTYFFIYKLLPKYLFERKSIWRFSLFFLLHFLVTSFIDRSFIAFMDSSAFSSGITFEVSFLNIQAIVRNALILLAVMGMASMIRFYRLYISNEAYQHALIQDNLQNQLAFFKAQVSPHFLFNALNNIYSDCIRKDEVEIASHIEHLSGIMRYLTYDSNSKFVNLSKEVQLIKDYIEVERMRISSSNDVLISFVSTGDFSKHVIAPVLLLPLVENVFKHGVAPRENSFIHINLKVDNNRLIFETRNKNLAAASENSGVGSSNVLKRLELLYKNRYTIDWRNEMGDFILSLKIDLKNEYQGGYN